MIADVEPADRKLQIAVVLIVPIVCFAIGAFFVPTSSSMSAARAGADREALQAFLLKTAPKMRTKVDVTLDNTLKILGTNTPPKALDKGDRIEVEMFLQSLKHTDRDWEIFMHIDRRGGSYRVHGDHFPVGGKYQTSLWEKGDIVRDVYSPRVPIDAPSGTYDVWIGFYIKKTRMRFTRGDKSRHDGSNRIRVGTVKIK